VSKLPSRISNSLTVAKMTSLCSGKYGLNSQGDVDDVDDSADND
jgi:hypothetical protein